MAATKKTKSKKTSTSTPAMLTLLYNVTNSATPGTETSHYIDLANDLSRINRRLYRQGRVYHVKRITVVSSNTIAGYSGDPNPASGRVNAGRIRFCAAPNTWVTRNAWQRGFELWNMMNKKAMAGASKSVQPTWHDYKVYLTSDMISGTNLTPIDNGSNAVQSGEWVYSKYESPDGTTSSDQYTAHLLGAHTGAVGNYGSVGLITSYGRTRASVQSTDPQVSSNLSDDPLANLFDDGTNVDEVLQNLEEDNDRSPYEPNNYVGGPSNMVKPHVYQDTTLGADGKATVGGFPAICGLLEIEVTSPIANDVYAILVELAPGKFRGVHAEVIV